jgi:hypothetical protein
MRMIDKPGVYKLTSEEYHADPTVDPSLSRSVIRDLIYKSPAHAFFKHPYLNTNFKNDDGDGKFDVGTAAHELLLEGTFNVTVVEADDWRTKAAKEARDLAKKEGKTPLLRHQYEDAIKMVESAIQQINGCPELQIESLENQGDSELSYIWQEDGLWLKVRPDWISKDKKLILDYKTTGQSANPSDIARHIVSMGYDIQNALYCRGVKAIEKTDPKFIFIFQETEEPYLCSFVGLPPDFLAMATQKVEYGIFLWGNCLSKNEWPGYPNQVAWVEPPPWALASWERTAAEIGV